MKTKNTLKKLFSLLLAFVLVISLVPVSAQAAEIEEEEPVEICDHLFTCKQTGNVMLYTCAKCGYVYAEEVPVATYNRVTKFVNGESYVICVYANKAYYALSHAGNRISAVKVEVGSNKVKSQVTEDLLWTYSGGKLSYKNGGTTYYLYNSSTSTGTLTVSTTRSSSISVSTSAVRVGSYYMKYTGGTIKTNRSTSTGYIFQENF